MHSTAETHRLTLEYLQDTLFGVNALSAECTVQVSCLPRHDDSQALCLRVLPPWPAQLEQAHAVAFDWRGQTCRGRVLHAKRLAGGDLQLEIERQSTTPAP